MANEHLAGYIRPSYESKTALLFPFFFQRQGWASNRNKHTLLQHVTPHWLTHATLGPVCLFIKLQRAFPLGKSSAGPMFAVRVYRFKDGRTRGPCAPSQRPTVARCA